MPERVRRWWLGLLLALAALPAWGSAAAPALRLESASLLLAPDLLPPPDTAAWRPQPLPDLWSLSRPGTGGTGWYRLRFTLPALPLEPWALYLPRLCMNAELFLNGVALGSGGQMQEPLARNWNRPLLFAIHPGLLRAGENTLHVRLQTLPFVQGSLSPPLVGPERALRPEYERQFLWRISLNQALSLITGAVGVLMLSLWWRRRQDTAYGFFGASALVWAFNSSNLYLRDVPLPTFLWEVLINATFQLYVALLLVFLLRFIGQRRPRLEAMLWCTALGSPLTLLLSAPEQLMNTMLVWHLLTLLGAVITLALLVRAALSQPSAPLWQLLAAMLVNVLFGAHDLLMHSKLLQFDDVYLLHYGAPVMFMIIGWIMAGHFVRALNTVEALNQQLELRVAAKHQELETQFARAQRLEREQAALEERERIYRDLHDDLGAKLLSLVYRAASPEDAELARSALQDLREAIARSDGNGGMEEALADWRLEADQRLGAAGIRLDWLQADALPGLEGLQAQRANIGRILREAVTNVIRHAGADAVSIGVDCRDGQLQLEVADNGAGFDPERASTRGRGRQNMQLRAQRMGGDIQWLPGEAGGCRVRLSVPLPA